MGDRPLRPRSSIGAVADDIAQMKAEIENATGGFSRSIEPRTGLKLNLGNAVVVNGGMPRLGNTIVKGSLPPRGAKCGFGVASSSDEKSRPRRGQ